LIGTCISFTFLNPFSHQSNLMVMQPGRYRMKSFAMFGVPLVAISVVAAIATAWLVVG
jgi:di/tricarboxylate transporter